MAISKRLRYEIFRRDNFTCRYCGRSAPDVVLRPDHVTPTALGGTDEPTNLVTSCDDCNSGKSSMPPDAPLVADVERDAIRWAQALRVAADTMVEERWEKEQRNAAFKALWEQWTFGKPPQNIPLPADWSDTLKSLRDSGLNDELIAEAVDIAMRARNVEIDNTFRYFCGVAWRKVAELQKRARAIADTFDQEY